MSVNPVSYPPDWEMTTLGEIANGFLSGGTPSTHNEEFWCGSVPWITSKWLNSRLYLENGEKFISEVAIGKSATAIVPRNSLIFATRVGVGKVAINTIDLAINQDLAGVLIDADRYDLRFLAYQLRSSRIQMAVSSHKRGATIQGITRDNLKKLEICLPPLSEQHKIAHILSTVQRAIEEHDRIIQTTTELKKALMQKLFTEGLRGEPQKETEIGLVPESWEVVPLGECAFVQTGIAKGRKIPPEEAIELPYLRVANVQDGYLDLAEMKSITMRKGEQNRYALQEGDVVLTEGGDLDKLGRGFIWHGQIENCVHQNHIFAVRPNTDRLSSEFFAYQSQSPYGKRYFLSVAHKTTNLACINTTKLKAFPVLLPPKTEQLEIVEACRCIDEKLQAARCRKAAFESLFRTLLHDLMTARIRVDELKFSALDVVA